VSLALEPEGSVSSLASVNLDGEEGGRYGTSGWSAMGGERDNVMAKAVAVDKVERAMTGVRFFSSRVYLLPMWWSRWTGNRLFVEERTANVGQRGGGSGGFAALFHKLEPKRDLRVCLKQAPRRERPEGGRGRGRDQGSGTVAANGDADAGSENENEKVSVDY